MPGRVVPRSSSAAAPGSARSRESTGRMPHLDPLAVLTAFGLIFVAELPDKTMFASLAMGMRMRPLYVWFGASSAFVVHVALAVGAGSLLGLLSDRVVGLISAGLFAVGAWMLLRGAGGEEDQDAGGPAADGFWKVYATAFTAVFIGEWGDLTQITTANLAATNGAAATAIGSAAALMSVSALALVVGRFITKRVPLRTVQRVGGLCMLALAVWSLVEALTG